MNEYDMLSDETSDALPRTRDPAEWKNIHVFHYPRCKICALCNDAIPLIGFKKYSTICNWCNMYMTKACIETTPIPIYEPSATIKEITEKKRKYVLGLWEEDEKQAIEKRRTSVNKCI